MPIDWSKTAFVFPGQASQVVGMGRDFAEAFPVARDTFAEADEIVAAPLSRIMFEGPAEELDDTYNTQPAIYVCSIAILRALQSVAPQAQPAFTAGHSLGELTALTTADSLSFADGLRLVRERGRLMKLAGEEEPGAMAAVIGLDADKVREICAEATARSGHVLVLANDNCPGQIVVSGSAKALEVAMVLFQEINARAIRLHVSIAPHSPLMASAQSAFNQTVERTPFTTPRIPVFANYGGHPLESIAGIRTELEAQLTNPVYWTDVVRNMIAAGAQTFWEIGPKNVLTGLLRRIDRSVTGHAIDTVEAMHRVLSD